MLHPFVGSTQPEGHNCTLAPPTPSEQLQDTPCPGFVEYLGETCREELLESQGCPALLATNQDPPTEEGEDVVIYVHSSINQMEAEDAMKSLVQALPLVGLSSECEKVSRQLLCLQLFGPCGTASADVGSTHPCLGGSGMEPCPMESGGVQCRGKKGTPCLMEVEVAVTRQAARDQCSDGSNSGCSEELEAVVKSLGAVWGVECDQMCDRGKGHS